MTLPIPPGEGPSRHLPAHIRFPCEVCRAEADVIGGMYLEGAGKKGARQFLCPACVKRNGIDRNPGVNCHIKGADGRYTPAIGKPVERDMPSWCYYTREQVIGYIKSWLAYIGRQGMSQPRHYLRQRSNKPSEGER